MLWLRGLSILSFWILYSLQIPLSIVSFSTKWRWRKTWVANLRLWQRCPVLVAVSGILRVVLLHWFFLPGSLDCLPSPFPSCQIPGTQTCCGDVMVWGVFRPLKQKFPWCSVGPAWQIWYIHIYTGRNSWDNWLSGPIVRVTSTELSIGDAELYNELYVLGGKRRTNLIAGNRAGLGISGELQSFPPFKMTATNQLRKRDCNDSPTWTTPIQEESCGKLLFKAECNSSRIENSSWS